MTDQEMKEYIITEIDTDEQLLKVLRIAVSNAINTLSSEQLATIVGALENNG